MCITKEFINNSSDTVLPGTCDSAIFDQPDTDFAFDISRNDCFRNGVSWVCDDTGDLVALVKRLGGRCPEIFAELLHRQLQSVGELANRIGCHPNVARNALKKLMFHSLVKRAKMQRNGERRKYLYVAPTNYDLHDTEIATHTFNKIVKVKRKHKEEREQYFESLTDDDARHEMIVKLRKENTELRRMMKEFSQRENKRKSQMNKLKAKSHAQ